MCVSILFKQIQLRGSNVVAGSHHFFFRFPFDFLFQPKKLLISLITFLLAFLVLFCQAFDLCIQSGNFGRLKLIINLQYLLLFFQLFDFFRQLVRCFVILTFNIFEEVIEEIFKVAGCWEHCAVTRIMNFDNLQQFYVGFMLGMDYRVGWCLSDLGRFIPDPTPLIVAASHVAFS